MPERLFFTDIVADTDSFELQGGLYRIGTVISGSNEVHLQTLAPDGTTWIDTLDHPIAQSGLSEEVSLSPGQYRIHLATDEPVSAVMTSTTN